MLEVPILSAEYIKVMNDAAKALKPSGLVCGHHNHTEEFKKVGDKNKRITLMA